MSYKLLILEDNMLLLQTLEDFLSEYSYVCTLVKSGKEALEACYQNSFDLYLVDVKVPDMNGFEFLQALRHSGDRTPAIFITSLNDQESVRKGFLIGGDDYIKKPFDLRELLLRIKAILARTKGAVDDWFIIDAQYKLNLARKRLFQGTTELDLNRKDFERKTNPWRVVVEDLRIDLAYRMLSNR